MDNLLSRQLAQGATLVVDDKLAATQLEAFLAREAALFEQGAWRSPTIQTHEDLCASLRAGNLENDRLLLSAAQSHALWRNIVATSPSGATLIDTARVAAWAREAWGVLQAWQLDFRELRARDDDPGFADFLSWAAKFDDRLTGSGWLDAATLTRVAAEQLKPDGRYPNSVVWADLRNDAPVLQTLFQTLDESGMGSATWIPEPVSRSVSLIGLEQSREELRQAIHWAKSKIDENPTARVALVVPMNVENELALARDFEGTGHERSSIYRLADGHAIEREPVIGAALDCLGLFSERADFQELSRFLRSPFVGAGVESLSVRCMTEADLRGELTAQLGFLTAYRSAGLDRSLERSVPLTRSALDRVLDRLRRMPRYQSPTRWAGVMQEFLTELNWPGTDVPVPGPVLDAWHRALEALAGLTPVLGSVDYERALAELRAGVSSARIPSRFSLQGVTVLSRLEDLGPGYDAAWIMGMSDRLWPRPAEQNPLLPHALQAVHKMPFATPADAVQRCRALTERLIARVPEVIFSYPLTENEFAAEASPLLREVRELDAGSLPALESSYAGTIAGLQLERLEDSVPAFSGVAIAGGAGTLAKQAICPLRAFIDSRLSVRPLEPPERGFGPRQRGILVHRALELLFAALPGKQHLVAQSEKQLDARIQTCIDQALRECVRGAGRSLRVYSALERDRLLPLIRELIELDLGRGEFAIESLETKSTARVGAFEVGCRIDRIDTLADGSAAIIDYKTGPSATPADWFRDRLVEPQLPLYLQVVGAAVDALVIGHVQPGGVAYRGLWQQPDAFPGSPYRPRSSLEWPDQQSRWSAQLDALVAEYAGGDGRIFVAGRAWAEGLYAPLTRVYEQGAGDLSYGHRA